MCGTSQVRKTPGSFSGDALRARQSGGERQGAQKVRRGSLGWWEIGWGGLLGSGGLSTPRGWVLPDIYDRIWKQGKRVSHLRTYRTAS